MRQKDQFYIDMDNKRKILLSSQRIWKLRARRGSSIVPAVSPSSSCDGLLVTLPSVSGALIIADDSMQTGVIVLSSVEDERNDGTIVLSSGKVNREDNIIVLSSEEEEEEESPF